MAIQYKELIIDNSIMDKVEIVINLRDDDKCIRLNSFDDMLEYRKEDVVKMSIINSCGDIPNFVKDYVNLEELSMNRCGKYMSWIRELKNLHTLKIYNSQIDTLPTWLIELHNLKKLIINDSKLTKLPHTIGNMKQLVELNLEKNKIEELPGSFEELKNLQYLSLGSNRFKSFPKQIKNNTNLISLLVDNNEIEDLPEWIERLTKLNVLNLSDNALNTVPKTIGNMTELRQLSFSRNNLTHIPDTIVKLNKLYCLHISNNKLTALPESIGKMNLSELIVKYNKLVRLPDSIINLNLLATTTLGENYNGYKLRKEDKEPRTVLGHGLLNLVYYGGQNIGFGSFYYYGNKIEYIPPHIYRFLKTSGKEIVIESKDKNSDDVIKSIHDIMNINLDIDQDKVINDIKNEYILTDKTKDVLMKYSNSDYFSFELFLTFKDLLCQVYSYFDKHLNIFKNRFLSMLNKNIHNKECELYSGRMYCLINYLNKLLKNKTKDDEFEDILTVIMNKKKNYYLELEKNVEKNVEHNLLELGYDNERINNILQTLEK